MLCMSKYLFEAEQKNRLEQKGLLKRFSLDCYGKQPTLEEMRAEKAKKYQELKDAKTPEAKKEFDRWFFKYTPSSSKDKLKKLPNIDVIPPLLKSVTKTIVLNEPESSINSKIQTVQTKKQKPRKKMRRNKNTQKLREKEDGPYAKRTFYFGKRK